MPDPMRPDFFRRVDESDDELFYTSPRLVVHIDDGAIAAVSEIYAQFLPTGGAVLDLMSSWRSHIPESVKAPRIVGLGLNRSEMENNPALTEIVVHNVNRNPRLPFPDANFRWRRDDGIDSVPGAAGQAFADVARVLKAHAPFIVTFSNRMFPTKAVAVWQGATDQQRLGIVSRYFAESGAFEKIGVIDRSRRPGTPSDPIWAVAGYAIAR